MQPDSLELIPIFPLQLIAYPYEYVPLHIFEPRYIRMINRCVEHGLSFGLVPAYDRKVWPSGTEMRVEAVRKRYADGRMDILCHGQKAFTVAHFRPNPAAPDDYHTAQVQYILPDEDLDADLQANVTALYNELHLALRTTWLQQPAPSLPLSYQLAPSCGLDTVRQIGFLGITSENARLEYLAKHIERALPLVKGIEATRHRLSQNGHYRLAQSHDQWL